MSNLIRALQIFLKVGDNPWPTNCSHDVLAVCWYDMADFSNEDLAELEHLGFFWSEEHDAFISFKYGSC